MIAVMLFSPGRAAVPLVSSPGCNRLPAGSRSPGSGSGWLSGPTLSLHQTARRMTGTYEDTTRDRVDLWSLQKGN